MKKVLSLVLAVFMTFSLCYAAGAEEVLTAILTAKTTQAFTTEAVSKEDLTAILEADCPQAAPSISSLGFLLLSPIRKS